MSAFTLLILPTTEKELSDYVQQLRTLIAAMQLDPLPEKVRVTIFMEGLRTGVARTEVFRVHPSIFEEAVDIARTPSLISKRLAMVRMDTSNIR